MREDEELTEAELRAQMAEDLRDCRNYLRSFWITFWVLSGIAALLYVIGQGQS